MLGGAEGGLDRPQLFVANHRLRGSRPALIVPQPRRIPAVLSVEQVTPLLRAATAPKYKTAFATAGACPGEGRGRRAARLGSRRAQGWRHRFRAHAAARRTRQGA
jgi:hypothetical protein